MYWQELNFFSSFYKTVVNCTATVGYTNICDVHSICVGHCDSVVYREVGKERDKDWERGKRLHRGKGRQKQRQESSRLAGWLSLLGQHFSVCTDLAAASTAAAAATMGSFTYKWKLPITRCWPHLFQRTDRQAGKASASELPNYSKLLHFHLHIRPVRPATIVPAVFYFPLVLRAPTTRSGVTLIGSGEFKGPVSGWGCHHPGQHSKETTYPAYHSAAQHCTA